MGSSILNTDGTANTLAKWNEIITTIQTLAAREAAQKVDVIVVCLGEPAGDSTGWATLG